MTGEFVTTDTSEMDILMLFTHAGEFVTTDTGEFDILMLFTHAGEFVTTDTGELDILLLFIVLLYVLSYPEKAYGESCSSAVECLVSGSVCSGGQCACPSTMYLQGMTCLNSKLCQSIGIIFKQDIERFAHFFCRKCR